MGKRGLSTILLLAALTALAGAGSAQAHQSPAACTSAGTNTSLDPSSGLGEIRRNGDHLELAARVRNDAAGACDVTDATITIQTPNPDGTPGPTTPVATGVNLLAGTPQVTLPGTVPHDVNFDAATFQGFVTVGISGTRHDGAIDTTGFLGSTGVPLVISKPHVTLNVAPVISSGSVPFTANYTYSLTNDSAENTAPGQPEPELGNGADEESVLADDTCANLTFTGGNTDGEFPPHVDRGETWTFSCNRVFDVPGIFTNTVRVTGTSNRDGRPWPQTTAQATVTALGSDLRVAKSHDDDFVAGQTGRAYAIVARNAGTAATSGAVTVQDSLPTGLTATAIEGSGWSCDLPALSCTRSDALAAGAEYPPVTVTVDVAADAPEQVTNVASVSGGGDAVAGNNTANDETAIARAPSGGGNEEPEDRDPPDGEIRKVKVKGDDVKVTFRSDEPGSTFECRLDKKAARPCTSPKRYRNLDDGKHKFFVVATDAAGNADGAVRAKFEVG